MLLAAGCALVSPARGEPSAAEQARAEALFDEGKRLMEQKRHDQACPKLEESLRIEEAGGTLAALALCHREQGRSATAWAEFKALRALAQKTQHEARRSLAEQSLRELEPTLQWLIVDVAPASRDLPSLEVHLDQNLLGRASWGVPIPLDPGPHTLQASAPGVVPWSLSLQLGPAPDRRSVMVPELRALDAPSLVPSASVATVAASSAPPLSLVAPEPAPRRGYTASIAVGSLGAVALLVGGAFGVDALIHERASNRRCPSRPCDSDEALSDNRRAIRSAWVADAGIGLGLVGLGIAYLLLPSSSPPSAARYGLGGVAQRGGGVLSWRGEF